MIATVRVVRAAAILELRYLMVSRFMLFCVTIQPFFIAVTAMFMIRRGAAFDPGYVMVGSALTGLWSLMLFSGNWLFRSERQQGTLELIVATPTPIIVIAAGRLIGAGLFSLISIAVCYAVGAWLFGYALLLESPAAFACSAALALGAMWATALAIAPLAILSRTLSQFLNVFEYPIYILSGFLFPVAVLPAWTTPVSSVLPTFWGATAVHLTMHVFDVYAALPVWVVLALSVLAVVLVARPLFALVVRRATIDGSLSLS